MPPAQNGRDPYADLPAFAPGSDTLNAIIETPRASRNKFKYDPELGIFRLDKVLPAGAVFPYDFGYVPSTLGGDGDPLDVLVLMDAPAFPGCLVPARLVGVLEATQEEDGKEVRNDRLLAVALVSHDQRDVRSIEQISDNLLREIDHFFVSYHEIQGHRFTPGARRGPDQARRIVDEGVARARNGK